MFRKGLENIAEPYRQLIAKLLDSLLLIFNDKLVSLIIYGSVARGDMRTDSDIDLLVVIEDLPKSRLKRTELFNSIEDSVMKDVESLYEKGYYITFSPLMKTPEEAQKISPLYLDMVEDCVIIYDKNNFFEKVLVRLSSRLKELGAERIWIGKKWYWRLKKDFKFGEVITIE